MNYLSIDVGGTYLKYSLVNSSGELVNVQKVNTPNALESFQMILFQLIEEVRGEIQGIGISLPGKIDQKKGVVYHGGSLAYLHKCPLKAWIEETFQLPCALSNDGKAAALAECWLGHLKGVQNGAAIVLGTGIGGGLILDGSLFQGSHFQAGELSFLMNYRVLKGNDSILAWDASAVNFIKKGCQLLNLSHLDDGEAVFAALEKGESLELQQLFIDYCQVIARIVLNLQVTLDLSCVVIGGGISAQNRLIEEIRKQYEKIRCEQPLLKSQFEQLSLLPCRFRNEANLLGAIYQLFLELEVAV